MESSSAYGENLNIKTRKPYTITKQREKWTEEEHNSFLEALKLYGRAWQKIEEHIGTKTAVQIRSHAQKFFTKLEKEAVAKGIPISQALDMEIPPPRPKRKPNYPYPRKTDSKTQTQVAEKEEKQATLVSSLQVMDLERNPLPEKQKEKVENPKTSEVAQNGTYEHPQEVPYASVSSENENFIPRSTPDVFRHDETNASYITIEARKHQEMDQDGIKHTNITSNISLFERSHLPHENNIIQGQYSNKPVNLTNDIKCVQTYPRHVPVQVVDGSQENTTKTSVPQDMSFHEPKVYEHQNPNVSVNIATASETSVHHNNATFHPLFNPFSDNNQESYRSFLHFSSTVSGLIVSSLLQNPAAHAAASFAAKFWHPINTEVSSADSFSKDQSNPETTTTPSMAAIAAATVAAATAWWSANGLLPVCTPFHQGGYSCTFDTPVEGNLVNKAPSEGVLQEEKMDEEKTESAADLSSSEDSEKKLNTEVTPVDANETAPVWEPHDSSKLANVKKQVDRSSSGSNTISSSEIETDALEKHVKEMEENKGSDVKESNSRRGRNTITTTDSWKEVSEEGRIAFRALFSREVLPQSFTDSHTIAGKNSELDLNRMSHEPWENNNDNNNNTNNGLSVLRGEEGVLRMGLESVKLNVNHTGFKPYKRCSAEAKENSKLMSAASTGGGQNDEKGPKRMCFETEAST
ncbi:protein LATE ELONGATED HYPOCOTYL-like isoform X2 [Bidens hawaiensis]|uniref:protein LATE ELONGATED HYPOCOTYL-like isoform X2 n=1 Tax=Bidens hawaiensis TaxID=980011 RepID=UPI00404AC51B